MMRRRLSRAAAFLFIAAAGCVDGTRRARDAGVDRDGSAPVDITSSDVAQLDLRGTADSGAVALDVRPADLETIARRLTKMLWDEPTDPAVLARLNALPLGSASVRSVAGGMLADPRARQGVRAFFRWWLLLDPLLTLEKEDPAGVLEQPLRQSMIEEAPALGVHLTLEAAGTFQDLLLSPFTFADERLAKHYGVSGVQGDEFRPMPYPAGQNRVGLLTGAGLLTLFASLSSPSWPAKRSWLVTDSLLCMIPVRTFLPPPPLDAQRSIREQMLDVTKEGSCMGCHKMLNSPGFAFIGFDSFGRWKPERGHGPGETQGWIPRELMPDAPTFDGPAELARLLAARAEAHRCFVRKWLQYAIDRDAPAGEPVTALFNASVEAAYAAFARENFRLTEALLAVTASPAFTASPTALKLTRR